MEGSQSRAWHYPKEQKHLQTSTYLCIDLRYLCPAGTCRFAEAAKPGERRGTQQGRGKGRASAQPRCLGSKGWELPGRGRGGQWLEPTRDLLHDDLLSSERSAELREICRGCPKVSFAEWMEAALWVGTSQL